MTYRCKLYLGLSIVVLSFVAGRAEVQVKEKSKLEFPGLMGKMFGFFGGKTAREGIVTTETVVGNRKMTITEETGEIIDLDEERIFELDLKKKSYRVMTFDEYRKRLEEAADQIAQSGRTETKEEEHTSEAAEPEKELEVDFEAHETGQSRTLNSYPVREVRVTITVREKGRTLEQGGGTVLNSNLWLTDKIPAMDEIDEFNRRYAERLYGSATAVPASAQMAAALAMYPAMTNALAKMDAEKVNLEGTPILTEMTMETVLSEAELAEQKKQQPEEEAAPSSVGGLLGGFGKKLGRKKSQPSDQPAAPGRKQVMKMTSELLAVSSAVSVDSVRIPAGFKEKK